MLQIIEGVEPWYSALKGVKVGCFIVLFVCSYQFMSLKWPYSAYPLSILLRVADLNVQLSISSKHKHTSNLRVLIVGSSKISREKRKKQHWEKLGHLYIFLNRSFSFYGMDELVPLSIPFNVNGIYLSFLLFFLILLLLFIFLPISLCDLSLLANKQIDIMKVGGLLMVLLKVWGEECYGARDGALSLPIYLPLCITATYAGSAARNCDQTFKWQDLVDKSQ